MDYFWTYLSLYWIEALLIAACLACIPASIAKKKGRRFGRWWVYGWLLFLIALIHSLCLPDDREYYSDSKYHNSVVTQINPNASKESLIKRTKLLIEDEKWDEAKVYCNHILDLDPENAETYLLLTLIDNKAKDINELAAKNVDIRESAYYSKVLRFQNDEIKATIDDYNQRHDDATESEKKESVYKKASELNDLHSVKSVKESIELLKTIPDYKDSEDLLVKYEEKIPELEIEEEEEKEQRKRNIKKGIIVLCALLIVGVVASTVLHKIEIKKTTQTDIESHFYSSVLPGMSKDAVIQKFGNDEKYELTVEYDSLVIQYIDYLQYNNNPFVYFDLPVQNGKISITFINDTVYGILASSEIKSDSEEKRIKELLKAYSESVTEEGSYTSYNIKDKPYEILISHYKSFINLIIRLKENNPDSYDSVETPETDQNSINKNGFVIPVPDGYSVSSELTSSGGESIFANGDYSSCFYVANYPLVNTNGKRFDFDNLTDEEFDATYEVIEKDLINRDFGEIINTKQYNSNDIKMYIVEFNKSDGYYPKMKVAAVFNKESDKSIVIVVAEKDGYYDSTYNNIEEVLDGIQYS